MKLSEITHQIKLITFHGNPNIEISEVVALDSGQHGRNTISWTRKLDNPNLIELQATSLICPEGDQETIELLKSRGHNLLFSDHPRLTFLKVMKLFDTTSAAKGISETAKIHPNSIIGANCSIGENVVIEENVTIGDDVTVLHNTVIKSGTTIGNHVQIGCNNTIGGVGFGYELLENGEYELIPHLGGVLIEDHVEIGNNTCIDRAVLGKTILHENVKVDNLVHIAHGCNIGKNSLIIANAMVAGSVTIGQNCWVAPSSSILNKLRIEDNSLIGMGSTVIKNVQEGEIVAGNPAKVLKRKDK